MAILLVGKTNCPICGKVIEKMEEVIGFPHIIVNEKDPLYALSDSSCHVACVNADPLGREMLAAADEYFESAGPGKRACVVCGNQVLNPDDYFLILHLGNPPTSQLAKFNYTHLHRSHIHDWKQADEFLVLARTAVDAGQWGGNVLARIISEIEELRRKAQPPSAVT